MRIIPLKREDLLQAAFHYANAHPIHQTGPAKGKPLGQRKVNRVLTSYIREMKSRGRLIERRPQLTPSQRVARFIFVPYTPDLFQQEEKGTTENVHV